MFYVTRFD